MGRDLIDQRDEVIEMVMEERGGVLSDAPPPPRGAPQEGALPLQYEEGGLQWALRDEDDLVDLLEALGSNIRININRDLIAVVDSGGTRVWDEGDPGGTFNRGKRSPGLHYVGPAPPPEWEKTGIDWLDMLFFSEGDDDTDEGWFVDLDRLDEFEEMRLKGTGVFGDEEAAGPFPLPEGQPRSIVDEQGQISTWNPRVGDYTRTATAQAPGGPEETFLRTDTENGWLVDVYGFVDENGQEVITARSDIRADRPPQETMQGMINDALGKVTDLSDLTDPNLQRAQALFDFNTQLEQRQIDFDMAQERLQTALQIIQSPSDYMTLVALYTGAAERDNPARVGERIAPLAPILQTLAQQFFLDIPGINEIPPFEAETPEGAELTEQQQEEGGGGTVVSGPGTISPQAANASALETARKESLQEGVISPENAQAIQEGTFTPTSLPGEGPEEKPGGPSLIGLTDEQQAIARRMESVGDIGKFAKQEAAIAKLSPDQQVVARQMQEQGLDTFLAGERRMESVGGTLTPVDTTNPATPPATTLSSPTAPPDATASTRAGRVGSVQSVIDDPTTDPRLRLKLSGAELTEQQQEEGGGGTVVSGPGTISPQAANIAKLTPEQQKVARQIEQEGLDAFLRRTSPFSRPHPSPPTTLHEGGVVEGFPGQNVPTTLQAGETVLTPEQMEALLKQAGLIGPTFGTGDIPGGLQNLPQFLNRPATTGLGELTGGALRPRSAQTVRRQSPTQRMLSVELAKSFGVPEADFREQERRATSIGGPAQSRVRFRPMASVAG